MYVVRLVHVFLFQTNDNDNKYLVEFDISCGLTELLSENYPNLVFVFFLLSALCFPNCYCLKNPKIFLNFKNPFNSKNAPQNLDFWISA